MSFNRLAMCRTLLGILEREQRGEADFVELYDGLLWAESVAAQLNAKLDRMMEEHDAALDQADR
jgi:hypothetical protein